jgi:hypothetical protein
MKTTKIGTVLTHGWTALLRNPEIAYCASTLILFTATLGDPPRRATSRSPRGV